MANGIRFWLRIGLLLTIFSLFETASIHRRSRPIRNAKENDEHLSQIIRDVYREDHKNPETTSQDLNHQPITQNPNNENIVESSKDEIIDQDSSESKQYRGSLKYQTTLNNSNLSVTTTESGSLDKTKLNQVESSINLPSLKNEINTVKKSNEDGLNFDEKVRDLKEHSSQLPQQIDSKIRIESTTEILNPNNKYNEETTQNSDQNQKEATISQRVETGRSFDIDKYVSPEFHNINNVFTQFSSAEVERYVNPNNYGEIYHSTKPVSKPSFNIAHDFNSELTTPKSKLFDSKFRQISNDIKYSLSQDENLPKMSQDTTKYNDQVSVESLLSRKSDNDTKVSIDFKNNLNITVNDNVQKGSAHKDLLVENKTLLNFQSNFLKTDIFTEVPKVGNETDSSLETSKNLLDFTSIASIKTLDNEQTTLKPLVRISLQNHKIETENSSLEALLNEKNALFKKPTLKWKPYVLSTPIPTSIDPLYASESEESDKIKKTSKDNRININKRGSTKFVDTVTSQPDLKAFEGIQKPNVSSDIPKSNSNSTQNITKTSSDSSVQENKIYPIQIAAPNEIKSTTSQYNQKFTSDYTTNYYEVTTYKPKMTIETIKDYQTENLEIFQSVNNTTSNNNEIKKEIKPITDSINSIVTEFSTTKDYRNEVENIFNQPKSLLDSDKFLTSSEKILVSTNKGVSSEFQNGNISKSTSPSNLSSEHSIQFEVTTQYPFVSDSTTENKLLGTTENLNQENSDTSTETENILTSTLRLKTNLLETETTEDIFKNPNSDPDVFHTTQNIISNSSELFPTENHSMNTGSDKHNFQNTSPEPSTTEDFLFDTTKILNISLEQDLESSTQITKTQSEAIKDLITSYEENSSTPLIEKTFTTDIISTPASILSKNTQIDQNNITVTDNKLTTQSIDITSNENIIETTTHELDTTSDKSFESSSETTTFSYDESELSTNEITTISNNETSETTTTFQYSKETSHQFDFTKYISSTPPTPSVHDTTQYINTKLFSTEISTETETETTQEQTTTSEPKIVVTTTYVSTDKLPKPAKIDPEDSDEHRNEPTDKINDYEDFTNDNQEEHEIKTNRQPENNDKNIIRSTAATKEEIQNGQITTDETTSKDPEESTEDDFTIGTVAAIIIASVAVLCLALLALLLVIMKKRQNRLTYGQRCTPVSLDAYSLDSVSIYNSVRRKGGVRASKRSYGNPAFDDSGTVTNPMNFAAMANFIIDEEAITKEFEEIPQVTVESNELPEGCESKNRYANVIPLPETKVVLSLVEGDMYSDYINANFVRGPKNAKSYYIACQAPMESTIDDFWRMIWENQSRVILMLTDLVENGIEKCTNYLPPSEVTDNNRQFGDYQITLKKREVRDKYIISSLILKNLVSNCWREVTHLWYIGWPDRGVPEETNSIIAFLIEARSYLKVNLNNYPNKNGQKPSENGYVSDEVSGQGPVVVHCSPGTGRTGTVLACDIAIREFELLRLVDIPKTVYRIRRDRAGAVQTRDQYSFIYKVINLYATKLTGGAMESI